MEIFVDFFQNRIMLISALSWIVAQLLKVIINFKVEKKFTFERLFGDGGMPSGHSATVTTLALLCGYIYGFDSVIFAISGIVAIIVMHDAMGVRLETGKQAESIKQIAETINALISEKDAEIRTEKLKILVGHTPFQVFFGCLLGVLVSVGYILIFKIPYAGGAIF